MRRSRVFLASLALAFWAVFATPGTGTGLTGTGLTGVGSAEAQDLHARLVGRAQGARDLVEDTQRLTPPPVPGDYVTTHRGPLTISYPPRLAPLVQRSLAHAERDARAVAAQLGVTNIPELDVRLVPDPDVMRALAPPEAPPPAYAVGVAYPEARLVLVSASAPRTWEASDMSQVLRHELSHLLLAEAAGHAELPRWLSEGVAVEQSGEHSFERFEALGTASFTGGILPLRRLDGAFSEGPGDVTVAYAQAADFVAYLLHADGTARFALMLSHVHGGLSLDDAIQETYGASLGHIENEWRRDLEVRFAFAPLWAGTGILWAGGGVLLAVAMYRRRKLSRQTLARWAREEKIVRRQQHPVRLTVVTPGFAADLDAAPPPTTHPPTDPPGEPSRDDSGLPTISLDGARHTLH